MIISTVIIANDSLNRIEKLSWHINDDNVIYILSNFTSTYNRYCSVSFFHDPCFHYEEKKSIQIEFYVPQNLFTLMLILLHQLLYNWYIITYLHLFNVKSPRSFC